MNGESAFAATKPLLLGSSLLLALLVVFLLLASGGALGSTDLLTNGGFEDGTTGWSRFPGDTIFVTVADPVHSGEWAASLNRSGVTGDIWIRQDVSVVAEEHYILTGWVYNNEPSFNRVCLRIRWPGHPSLDVQSCVDGLASYYRPITVSSTSPPGATTARIMAMAEVGSVNPPHPVYFDDLSFTSNVDPTPIPTPTPRPFSVFVPLVLKSYP
jgi:hypothetical protein